MLNYIYLAKTKKYYNFESFIKLIFNNIDFELTRAQKRVLREIKDDLSLSYAMNRLLQGDVGSGKTIIGVLASAIAVSNNAQVAIMAPTEILAKQHFMLAKKLFQKNINIELLSSKVENRNKKKIADDLKNNKIKMLFGTHAIFQKK